MRVAFLNPQGNFDPADSHWTQHPDFGGQLVYVKEAALAMAEQGWQVDIITRRIVDPAWPQFASKFDAYPATPTCASCGSTAAARPFWSKKSCGRI